MPRVPALPLIISLLGLVTTVQAAPEIALDKLPVVINTVTNPWYRMASAGIEKRDRQHIPRGEARNIILFLGDGMSLTTVTAARILQGQRQGGTGEENNLSFDLFPYTGLSKTYTVDSQTPDSAGTMTAIVSGVKTDSGILGIDEDVIRGNCHSATGNELFTILELAEITGKSTGIVSTTRITHATPAASYAKSADRDWESDSDIPEAAKKSGCKDIAWQLVNFESLLEARMPGVDVDGIDVVMGGGRRAFLPAQASFNSRDADGAVEGKRSDGQDLTAMWKKRYPGGHYLIDKQGFNQLDANTEHNVLALFNSSHMHYEADRHRDLGGEPSLSEMTRKAINILKKNDKGFLLIVEAGRIDHGHHVGNAQTALNETIELSNAVAVASELTSDKDSLIIVTADHSHVFTMAGYPRRGNPILGKVIPTGQRHAAKALDGLPYTTLGYANGQGFANAGQQTNADSRYHHATASGRRDLRRIDTHSPGFHQEALVPLSIETHSGEDVAVYARGPGAALVSGSNEQNTLFHVMEYAADLLGKANFAQPAMTKK